MPLQHATQRIYESGPPRDRSPVHHDREQTERFPVPTEQTAHFQLPMGQPKPQKPQQPHKTPLRERMHTGHIEAYDGPADRHLQIPQTTLKKPGPMRAGSEPRRPVDGVAARTAARPGPIDPTSLKVEVPNTMRHTAPPMKHQMSQSTDASGLERGRTDKVLSRNSRAGYIQPTPVHTYNNDETSATFDTGNWDNYGDSDIEPQGEPTAIHRGPTVRHTDIRDEFVDSILPGEVDAAWAADGGRGNARFAGTQSDQPNGAGGHREASRSRQDFLRRDDDTLFGAEEDRDDLLPQQRPVDGETPSKPPVNVSTAQRRPGKPSAGKNVTVRDPAKALPPQRESSPLEVPISNPHLPKYHEFGLEKLEQHRRELEQKTQKAAEGVSKSRTSTVSKVPESQETSDDEQPMQSAQAQPSKKRSIDEIDYDIEKLKTMSYAELDSTPFLSDPRAPYPQPRLDSNGTPISLQQRLASLSRMNADDQKSLFQSLTDAENEEAGQWFVESFADDLKRLMEVRLERRKTALRYEMEARKRQKEVETKSEDLDRELADLKKGGSQLIEGRSSPRPAKAG